MTKVNQQELIERLRGEAEELRRTVFRGLSSPEADALDQAAEALQSLLVENERAFREGYRFGFVATSLLGIDEDWEAYKASGDSQP